MQLRWFFWGSLYHSFLFLQVLSHGRKSKLSGCQQCLSVASSILLSLFVSPVITAVTVGKSHNETEMGGCVWIHKMLFCFRTEREICPSWIAWLHERSLNRGGSYNRLFACRGGRAPDAHLRVWGRGTLSVPESLGVWKLPKESWGAQHSGTGEPRQMYVSCCELCWSQRGKEV